MKKRNHAAAALLIGLIASVACAGYAHGAITIDEGKYTANHERALKPLNSSDRGVVSSAATKQAAATVVVQPGDSLWVIAERYHLSVAEVLRANPALTNRPHNVIYAGERLTVPNKEVLTGQESEVVKLINSARAKAGLPALLANDTALNRSARIKAEDMAQNAYFSHTSPTFGDTFQQMRSMGVTYRAAGENIAKGQQTAGEVVAAWMGSAGHKKNIMGAYTHIGVGVGVTNYGKTWTAQFIKK